MRDEFLWVEKYRPKKIEDCILPAGIKDTFQQFVNRGEIPNLLLAGPAGCGKTTVAKALCHELGVDYYVINGSDEGRFLETVRNNAKNFASTVSLSSEAKHKVIIIDEADTQHRMSNSYLGRRLRNLLITVDSYSPAIIRIKSLNPSIPGVLWLTSLSKVKRSNKSQDNSSRELLLSWMEKRLDMIRKS